MSLAEAVRASSTYKVADRWQQRLRECIRAKGQHFKQMLLVDMLIFLAVKSQFFGISHFFCTFTHRFHFRIRECIYDIPNCHSPI